MEHLNNLAALRRAAEELHLLNVKIIGGLTTEVFFGDRAVTVPMLEFGTVRIYPHEMKVPSLKGESTVWAYMVEGYKSAEDGVEPFEVGICRTISETIVTAFAQVVRDKLELLGS